MLLQVLPGCHSSGLCTSGGNMFPACLRGPGFAPQFLPPGERIQAWAVVSQAGAVPVSYPWMLLPDLEFGCWCSARCRSKTAEFPVCHGVSRGAGAVPVGPWPWDVASSREEAGLQWECQECNAPAVWGSVGSRCVTLTV